MANIFDIFKKIETSPQSPSLPITHIIAGLGNPGAEYRITRHNMGFMAMDYISQKLDVKVNKLKFHSLCADTVIEGTRVLLMKPQLFMNRSGEAIREASDFYKIPPENIIVISDDVSLDPGKMRIRRKGSDGGHKGLNNIIFALHSDNFPRIRLGVGAPPPGGEMVNWVLGNIPESEREGVYKCIEKTFDAIPLILSGNIEKAMCDYN